MTIETTGLMLQGHGDESLVKTKLQNLKNGLMICLKLSEILRNPKAGGEKGASGKMNHVEVDIQQHQDPRQMQVSGSHPLAQKTLQNQQIQA